MQQEMRNASNAGRNYSQIAKKRESLVLLEADEVTNDNINDWVKRVIEDVLYIRRMRNSTPLSEEMKQRLQTVRRQLLVGDSISIDTLLSLIPVEILRDYSKIFDKIRTALLQKYPNGMDKYDLFIFNNEQFIKDTLGFNSSSLFSSIVSLVFRGLVPRAAIGNGRRFRALKPENIAQNIAAIESAVAANNVPPGPELEAAAAGAGGGVAAPPRSTFNSTGGGFNNNVLSEPELEAAATEMETMMEEIPRNRSESVGSVVPELSAQPAVAPSTIQLIAESIPRETQPWSLKNFYPVMRPKLNAANRARRNRSNLKIVLPEPVAAPEPMGPPQIEEQAAPLPAAAPPPAMPPRRTFRNRLRNAGTWFRGLFTRRQAAEPNNAWPAAAPPRRTFRNRLRNAGTWFRGLFRRRQEAGRRTYRRRR